MTGKVVKKSGRDEPIWVVIHMHGSNVRKLSVYLSLSKGSKNAMSFLLEKQRAEQDLSGSKVVGERDGVGVGCSMVQTMYTHMNE
jgi:hypothetical protein